MLISAGIYVFYPSVISFSLFFHNVSFNYQHFIFVLIINHIQCVNNNSPSGIDYIKRHTPFAKIIKTRKSRNKTKKNFQNKFVHVAFSYVHLPSSPINLNNIYELYYRRYQTHTQTICNRISPIKQSK